jgi:hypothetical protein
MGLLLSNNKHVETKIEWNHGANSNQLYRPEGSLTGGKASPADRTACTSVTLSLAASYFFACFGFLARGFCGKCPAALFP